MKLPRLTGSQAQNPSNVISLFVLRLIVTGRTLTTCKLYNFITDCVRLILERLRVPAQRTAFATVSISEVLEHRIAANIVA
ncbi:hypothetical protein BG57_00870 [Caballeronia grimmiae]|uniref:Uncharacterized protein n=1 Tax=Caballeronia grimmiae TaxID=1071679 RepID=A0A069PJG6_9BURK|nr:hypothetical protein BG57_00870 [Caballeronia grimmiae]